MYGSLWKMQDQSMNKYVSSGQSGLESRTKVDKKKQDRKEKLGKRGSP